MKNFGYNKYIEDYVTALPYGVALHTANIATDFAEAFHVDIGKARKTVNVYLKRLADQGILAHIMRGLYGKNKLTAFGMLPANKDDIVGGLLTGEDDDTIGYVTGAALLNEIGLSTLIPKVRTVATNNYRMTIPNGVNIKTVKPMIPITKDNVKYLKALDAFRAIMEYPVDTDNPDAVLVNALETMGVSKDELIRYAYRYGDDKTLRRVVGVLLGGETDANDIAQ
jgi:hypothetical protein